MAANGFIELLRLAKRGNKHYVNRNSEVDRWSGIAFEMMGQYFVAPLGEISEVIYPPKCTPVPNTCAWMRGVANIRGRLLSVSDLSHYLTGQRSQTTGAQKVLCIAHDEHYVGLIVDQVLGIQHFNTHSFFSAAPETVESELQDYCQGYFHQHNQKWQVFLFSQLLQNPKYMNASIL
jgi:twitching motility protein PilI